MANSKPYLPDTEVDLTARYNRDRKKQFGILRQNLSATTPGSQALSGSRGSSGGGSGNQLQDSFLKTQGDTMVGPIAFAPQDVLVQDDGGIKFIDVGVNTQDFSSNLIVLGEAGAPSDLDRIDNFEFAGQFLLLQAVVTTPITLKHQSSGGNIWLPSLTDYTMGDAENVLLKYDSINGWWSVVSNFGGSGADGGCPPICNENDLGDVSGAVTVDWSLARFHRMVLVGDVTITFSNLPTSIEEQDICIEFLEDASGGYEVSWTTTFANSNIPFIFTGAERYTSVQVYAYEDPAGTPVVQAFNKETISTGAVPGQPGVFSGFGGYIHAGLTFDQQSNLTSNNHIEFDRIIDVDTLSLSTSGTGQERGTFSGFRIGHVYQCTCYLAAKGSSNLMSFQAQFYDNANGQFIGTRGHVQGTTEPINDGFQSVAVAFFTATSVASSLEVRILDDQLVDKILNGESTSESACTVIIKDCGITEEVISSPAPDEGELDIREFFMGSMQVNSSAVKYCNVQRKAGAGTSSQGQQAMIAVQGGQIKKMFVDVGTKSGGDRVLQILINGVPQGPVLTIDGTGFFKIDPIAISFNQDDTIEWRTSGGGTTDKFNWTLVVWWL